MHGEAREAGRSMFERIGRQMLELGQPQVGNGDEVLARPEATSGPLGVLHQSVHRLHKRIAAPLLHARDHALEVRLERIGNNFI